MSAYLFTHFTNDSTGDKESIWFALSRDGLHWKDLGGEKPFLISKLGTTGIRDPFIVYDEKKKKYFIIGTDLHTCKGGTWDDFSSRGSRSLLVWESEDLVNWSEERLIEVGIPEAGCVWAPEAVYCKEEEKWFVFWASNVKEKGENEAKQRIYASFTEDFITFTPAFKYIEGETALIDTNIVYDNGWYYRISKDETNKVLILERSRKLIPDENEGFEKIHSDLLAEFMGLEGPEAYYLENEKKWCLIADQYHTGRGYIPMLCEDLSTGVFTIAEDYDMGNRKKRHGGVIQISDELADKLEAFFE